MDQTDFDKTPSDASELTREQITALLELARSLLADDPVRAATYAQQARSNAQRIDDQAQIAASLHLVGQIFARQQRFDLALNHLLDALELYRHRDDTLQITVTLADIGHVYKACGFYTRALEYYGDALNVEGLSDLQRSALYGEIAQIYRDQGDHLRSREYATKRLDLIYEVQLNEIEEANALHDLAWTHYDANNYAPALQYAKASLDLHPTAATSATLGEIYFAREAFPQAKTAFEESLKQDVLLPALLGLAKTDLKLDNASRAIQMLERALGIAPTAQQAEIHRLLAHIYRERGETEKAFHHYENALSVTNNDALKRLQTIHSVEIARKDGQIYRIKDQMRQREAALRQEAQQKIEAMQREIEQQIAQRDNVVSELNAFAHTVAHDLKSPLSLLVGFAGLVLDSTVDQELSEEAQASVEMMAKSAHRMNNIIDELLLLAGVRDQEQVTIYPLNMTNIIEEVEARLAYDISEKDAKIIKPDNWHKALGYGPWIEAVWANYISNAIKYGGEPPIIELGCAMRDDGMIRFWVKDNGNGITPENQAKLFSEFMRLDQARARGHGLGLSIVKRIVNRLGGEVGVESKAISGHGSIFYFTLPVASPLLED